MRIGHYVERWLELSAGFVASHVEASRHDGVVISREAWQNLDAFPHRPRHSLHVVRDRTPEPWKAAVLHAQLAAILTARRVDLVHVHFGYAAADAITVTRHRPFVLSLHGHDATGLLHDDPHRYREVAPAVAAVIVPSRFLADAAVRAGFTEDTVHVIPAGVNTRFFTPTPMPQGPPVVAFVGRLVEKKGIDVLMAVWPRVATEIPAARLAILGAGPLESLLPPNDRTVRHITPDAKRRREQVRDLLRQATVVVTPSKTAADGDSESLLLVNLEAGACGRPVVSTRHGGIPEYVGDGRTGLLVDEADADQFADALLRVLSDRRLATTLGTNAAAHVAQWDLRAQTAKLDDLYESLLPRGAK